MDKLGILHANQTYMCLDPHQNEGLGSYRETSLSIPVIFLLTIPKWYFFCGSFYVFFFAILSCLCHLALWSHARIGPTSWLSSI